MSEYWQGCKYGIKAIRDIFWQRDVFHWSSIAVLMCLNIPLNLEVFSMFNQLLTSYLLFSALAIYCWKESQETQETNV